LKGDEPFIGEGNFIRCAALFVLQEMKKMNDAEHFFENALLRSGDASECGIVWFHQIFITTRHGIPP
jgi:hypothetical protein